MVYTQTVNFTMQEQAFALANNAGWDTIWGRGMTTPELDVMLKWSDQLTM